jgi:hypothetical protein
MNQKRITFIFVTIGVLLVTVSVFLMTASPVKAQCGSQASSCKNCHETQAQDPVNNDGTTWHTQHAFGDFCYLCHAGNNQATDKVAAHTGMVDPLADVDASCKSCHPTDTLAKAQVYATALGKQLGSGGSTTGSGLPAATAAPAISGGSTAPVNPAIAAVQTTQLDVNDPNLVDYVQNYDEVVLGRRPTNWGNVILIVMIAMLGLGGGGFVITREKLVKISFGDTKKVEGEYSGDVVEMLPNIARLKPQARKSLKNILDNPKKTEKVLDLIDEVTSDEKEKE